MQLAWFKSADVYIGQGLVLLKIGYEKEHIFEFSLTMPIDRMLSSCTGLLKKGTRLKIILSNTLCSPVHIKVPEEIVLTAELQAYLSATAAQQLNAPSVQFNCAIDSKNRSLAAAIPSHIHNTIKAWTTQEGCSITSIRPMWSVLTEFAGYQKENIQGLMLHEPNGSMLIVETQNNTLQTMSWRGQLTEDVMQANISRALVGFNLMAQNVQSFKFSAKSVVQMHSAPAIWPNHWSAL